MLFTLEISKPFQKKIGVYRSETTILRIWWLWFAFSIHKQSLKTMLEMAANEQLIWQNQSED